MSKQVSFTKEKVLEGLRIAAKAVGDTIGPRGQNTFMGGGIPRITNDGFTVATAILFEDPEIDLGAYIVRNVTGQQNDDVGDGTTTVSILTASIIEESLKRPENPVLIKDSLKEAGDKILKQLAKTSIKIEQKDVEKVALISSENKNLARIISEITGKLGEKAVINVEDSKTFATEYEITDGFEVKLGFLSPAFITEKKSARAIYTDVPVLCVEKKISNIAEIAPIFKMFEEEKINSCVIVCDEIDDSMLGILAMNKQLGRFNSVVIRASAMFLDDIAGYVGAKKISNTTGVGFHNFKKEDLGFAKKVVSDANKSLFIGNGFSHKEYVKELQAKTDGEPNIYTRENMQKRVHKLSGGIAVLKIGAPTDFEREYLKYKAEDAVKAVKSALEEGVVEGGGMAFYRLSHFVPKTIGEEILKKSLTAPFRRIVENAGQDYAEIVKNLPDKMGYDAKKNCFVEMIKEGIIDPAKVERCALENAVSAASTFITTSCFITDVPEKK